MNSCFPLFVWLTRWFLLNPSGASHSAASLWTLGRFCWKKSIMKLTFLGFLCSGRRRETLQPQSNTSFPHNFIYWNWVQSQVKHVWLDLRTAAGLRSVRKLPASVCRDSSAETPIEMQDLTWATNITVNTLTSTGILRFNTTQAHRSSLNQT